MARVSIYVPDDLKARMDRVGDAANWSEVVRPAILSEVASHEHRKGASMTTVVERLRASKEMHAQKSAAVGRVAGRAWAFNRAEYAALVRVSRIEEGTEDGWAFSALRFAVDPEKDWPNRDVLEHLGFDEDFLRDHGLDWRHIPDELLGAFIEGAQEVFEQVEDKL